MMNEFHFLCFYRKADESNSFCVLSLLVHLVHSTPQNDFVYNDIAVIAIEFHGPGHDASL